MNPALSISREPVVHACVDGSVIAASPAEDQYRIGVMAATEVEARIGYGEAIRRHFEAHARSQR